MGIDPLKPQGPTTVSQPTEAAPAESTPSASAPEPVARGTTEGFDPPKKKLVSVTGRYVAHKPSLEVSEELRAFVGGQRGAGSVTGPASQKDTTLDTAADVGAPPGPRAAGADFLAQAKKAAKPGATADDLEQAAIELGKAALKKDFGVEVKDGNRDWSAEELARAYESFSAMPAGDQAKLKGLSLLRQREAPPESQAEARGGTVAGEYNPNVKTKDGERIKGGSISIYDAAFPSGNDPDSRRATMQVFIHEAGHAVEGRARDDAVAAVNVAVDAQNTADDKLEPTLAPAKQAWDDYNSAATSFRYTDKAGGDFAKAQQAVGAASAKLQAAKTPEELADAQGKLDAAKAKRDAALSKLSGTDTEDAAKAWASASDGAEQPIKDYAQAHVAYLQAKGGVDAAKRDLQRLGTVDGKTSKELAAFKAAKGREGAVSPYGASASGEGYAEAYALYQRDPKLMHSRYPNQYKFFHQNHQSPNDP